MGNSCESVYLKTFLRRYYPVQVKGYDLSPTQAPLVLQLQM